MQKSISVHDLMPSNTIMEEVIFEQADLVGNSKATNELYWIRNRINNPKIEHMKRVKRHLKLFRIN